MWGKAYSVMIFTYVTVSSGMGNIWLLHCFCLVTNQIGTSKVYLCVTIGIPQKVAHSCNAYTLAAHRRAVLAHTYIYACTHAPTHPPNISVLCKQTENIITSTKHSNDWIQAHCSNMIYIYIYIQWYNICKSSVQRLQNLVITSSYKLQLLLRKQTDGCLDNYAEYGKIIQCRQVHFLVAATISVMLISSQPKAWPPWASSGKDANHHVQKVCICSIWQ